MSSPRKRGPSIPERLRFTTTAPGYWMPAFAGMTAERRDNAAPLKSKPQHRLGNDVLLDLVRTAEDRYLAVVEVAGCDHRGPVVDLVRTILVVRRGWRGERADHIHHQFGGRLLQLRALDLQNGGCGIGLPLLAMLLAGDDPHLVHLARLQLDLDRR